jgi:hypothetical protein
MGGYFLAVTVGGAFHTHIGRWIAARSRPNRTERVSPTRLSRRARRTRRPAALSRSRVLTSPTVVASRGALRRALSHLLFLVPEADPRCHLCKRDLGGTGTTSGPCSGPFLRRMTFPRPSSVVVLPDCVSIFGNRPNQSASRRWDAAHQAFDASPCQGLGSSSSDVLNISPPCCCAFMRGSCESFARHSIILCHSFHVRDNPMRRKAFTLVELAGGHRHHWHPDRPAASGRTSGDAKQHGECPARTI